MIRINLLPVKAAQKKEKLRGQMILLAASLVLSLVCFGAVYTVILSKVSGERDEIARLEQEANRLKKAIGEVGQVKKLQEELQGKLDVLAQLKAGKSGPVHYLDQLSQALPERTWLTGFKETAGSVSITGIGFREESIADFMRSLDASGFYKGVELQVIERVTQDNTNLHKFEVACKTDPTGKSVK
ncbi:MAG: PilN domain-containing protein [Desulfuromonadales bacterium]|nr:PilN domain-containing protein [Desulfuromonadales bacterium]